MSKKKPNILWIMTDQQSCNMMSCAGNSYISTPNMDYLAKHGVSFERAYCSNPVCLPSRLGMMTGTYPGDFGIKHNASMPSQPWPPKALTDNGIGKLLSEVGYHTVYGGKEHLPGMRATDLGFEMLTTEDRDGLAKTCANYLKNYTCDQPFFMVASFINPHDICFFAINDFKDTIMEENQAFANKTGKQESAYNRMVKSEGFGVLETKIMHDACALPAGMHENIFWDTVCPPLPENYQPAKDEPEAISLMLEECFFKKAARKTYSDQRWRLHRWCYKNLTELVDREIGRLLSAVIECGFWDDTVIIFLSDHGDLDAAHKMEHKTALYEEAVHVPMIIKGVKGSQEDLPSEFLVTTGLDCLPTILDYAGVAVPEFMTGISLRQIVETGKCNYERKAVVIESEFGIGAVSRTGKYVKYDSGQRNEQYYDRETNKGEMHDQSLQSKFSGDIAMLKDAVEKHLRQRRNAGQEG